MLHRRLNLAILLAAAIGLLAAPARAQQLLPVDQAVGDMDPLSLSLRQVETGLRSDGDQTALYRLAPDPGTALDNGFVLGQQPTWFRIGPGFRAQVSRIDYLVIAPEGYVTADVAPSHDGEFIEFEPFETIFDLRPDVNPQPVRPAVAGFELRPTRASVRPAPQRIEAVRLETRVAPTRVDTGISNESLNGPLR